MSQPHSDSRVCTGLKNTVNSHSPPDTSREETGVESVLSLNTAHGDKFLCIGVINTYLQTSLERSNTHLNTRKTKETK